MLIAGRIAGHACRLILGAVFLYAGVIKGLDPEGFGREVAQYGILSGWLAQAAAYALIPFEVTLGASLLMNWRPRLSLGAGGGLILLFIGAISYALATGQNLEGCGCFGRAIPRTPEQTLIEDALFLAASIVGWLTLGRADARPARFAPGIWKTATLTVVGIGSASFALASPHLPIDDAVTDLRPGVSWQQLEVALAEADLTEGSHLVALLGMKLESSAEALPALNAMAAKGELSVLGLYEEDEAAYTEFLFTRGPAFPLYNVSPSDMRRLYRRLPRFFAVTGGRVAATWDEPPSEEAVRAALGAGETNT